MAGLDIGRGKFRQPGGAGKTGAKRSALRTGASVSGLVKTPLVYQCHDLVLITELVGVDRAVMTAQIDEHDGHVGGDRMVDAKEVSEIEPAIVLRIPPGEQEVGGATRLPGIGRGQIEKGRGLG